MLFCHPLGKEIARARRITPANYFSSFVMLTNRYQSNKEVVVGAASQKYKLFVPCARSFVVPYLQNTCCRYWYFIKLAKLIEKAFLPVRISRIIWIQETRPGSKTDFRDASLDSN